MSKKTVTRSTTVNLGRSGSNVTYTNTSKVPSRVPLVFAIIFAVLLVIMVVKTASGNPPVTFTSLLEFLSTIERPFVNFSIGDYTITADWGLINGLRDFFNVFMSLVGILVFTAKSLIHSLAVVFKLVGFILF